MLFSDRMGINWFGGGGEGGGGEGGGGGEM